MWGTWGVRRRRGVAVALGGALLVAACRSGGDGLPAADAGGAPGADVAAFNHPGSYPVGVRTLQVDDTHRTEVFYPAAADGTAGKAQVTYDPTTGMTDGFAALVPRFLRIPKEVPAYRDVPVSATGHFPVVVFTHGFGGWRTLNATLLAQIASWGFVVAATDKPDQTFQAVFSGHPADWDANVDAALLSATLDLVIGEGKPGGALAGAVDATRVAVIGYSSGGADAYAVLGKDRRFDAGIVWNYSVAGDVGPKPLMIITTDGDPVAPHVEADFARLKGPSRLIQLSNSGHMVSTDVCDGITRPNGLLSRLQALHLTLPKSINDVIRDGCEPGDLPVDKGQAIYLHFTVAELRDVFGIGHRGAGLGEEVVADLPALVVYQQRHVGG